jgi:phosphoribosylamine--glycine ligase
LRDVKVEWSGRPHVTVVLASEGYPGKYPTGLPVTGLEQAESGGAVVFHAGTRRENGQVLTNGGRVLAVTAGGKDIAEARSLAYEGASKISFRGGIFRRDIALRAAGSTGWTRVPRPDR